MQSQIKMSPKISEFRNGIFALHTRRFGTVAEIMIRELYGYAVSSNNAFDAINTETFEHIEIKFSTVLKQNRKSITENNVLSACIDANLANRMMYSTDTNSKFDCNIQQIKRDCFDTLYYGLFFADQIEIFMISSEEIALHSEINYSNKMHRGNSGEGQFHINNSNIAFHRQHFRLQTLTYEELYKLFRSNSTR